MSRVPWWRKVMDVFLCLTVGSMVTALAGMVTAFGIRFTMGRDASGPVPELILLAGTAVGSFFGIWIVLREGYLDWLRRR